MKKKILCSAKKGLAGILAAAMLFGSSSFDMVRAEEGVQIIAEPVDEDAQVVTESEEADVQIVTGSGDTKDAGSGPEENDGDTGDVGSGPEEDTSNEEESVDETGETGSEEEPVDETGETGSEEEPVDGTGEAGTEEAEREDGAGNAEETGNDETSMPSDQPETGDEEQEAAIVLEEVTEAAPLLLMAAQAEEGTLQAQINNAPDGVETTITLEDDYIEDGRKETLVIPDGKVIILDLNGHVLGPDLSVRQGEGVLNAITVYGTLTLTGEGALSAEIYDEVQNVRGVTVASGGVFTMESGTIANFSVTGNGAGVQVENHGTFLMNGGTISDNTAGGYGGGVFAHDGNEMVLKGGTISDNTAENGGGVAISLFSEEAWQASGVIMFGNIATSNGGGLYTAGSLNRLTLNQVTLEDNTAEASGGGFYTNDAVTEELLIQNCSVTGNRAVRGGGLYTAQGSMVTLQEGDIAGNQASLSGGGFYLDSANSNGKKSVLTMNSGRIGANQIEAENRWDSTWGAGLYLAPGSTLYFGGTALVEKNSGAVRGGGIAARDHASIYLTGGMIQGNSAGSELNMDYGGGIYKEGVNGFFEMSGGLIVGNTARGDGGGVQTSKSLKMTGGEISGNTATASGGGIGGPAELSGSAAVKDNTAASWGGGIYGTLTITENASVTGNRAGNGGGHRGNLHMSGGVISGNTATGSGGGSYISGASELTGGEISGNTATSSGGGIQTETASEIKISGEVRIENNMATNGGGISLYRGQLLMPGGIITGNTAANGGGIYQYRYSTVLNITGGTISGNSARNRKAGRDLYVNNGYDGNYSRPVFHLCAPADLTSESGQQGTAWYAELTDENIETAFDNEEENKVLAEKDLEGTHETDHRAYTFLYDNGEETASLTADMGSQVYASVQAAVDAAAEQGLTGAAVTLLKDSQECVTIPEHMELTLDLDGHTLRGVGGSVILISRGADLTIQDGSEAQTGKITGGTGSHNPVLADTNTDSYGGGLFIMGTVHLEGGSICGNHAAYGSGVYVAGPGKFYMSGGAVENNNGMGVHVSSWAKDSNGTFEMTGGTIAGNTNSGVYLYAAGLTPSFLMEGGIITGNSGSNGAGIHLEHGSVTIQGGSEISNNKSTGNGGGIAVFNNTTLTIAGGHIAENTAVNGGGISEMTATLTMTGGTITGNTATNGQGGGLYISGGSSSITGGSICENECSMDSNDIYHLGNRGLILMAASDMEMGEYECWYDAYDGTDITEKIEDAKPGRTYQLTASRQRKAGEKVARIGNTTYDTVQAAVNAAREEDVIYLLKDHCERVKIGTGQKISVDLNGYTLSTDHASVFYVYAGSLTLRDTSQGTEAQGDAKQDGAGGRLVPVEGSGNLRAVYVTGEGSFVLESGTITGFTGMTRGGGIYASEGCTVEIRGGAVTENQAEYGGGIYLQSTGSKGLTFSMTGGTVSDNEAGSNGGGVCIDVRGGSQKVERKISLTGGSISGNTAADRGGGLWIQGPNGANGTRTSVTFEDVTIENNQASGNGGGIYSETISELTVGPGTRILGNRTTSAGGAGLYCYTEPNLGQMTWMNGAEISGNMAVRGNGAGAYVRGNAQVVDVTVTGNFSQGNYYGGGLLFSMANDCTVNLEGRSLIQENSAYNGGGVYVSGTGSFELGEGVRILDNDAYFGGGMCFGSLSKASLNGGEISGNHACYGGGITSGNASSINSLVMKGVEISHNEAVNSGGGCSFRDLRGGNRIEIGEGTVISGNRSGASGGGLWLGRWSVETGEIELALTGGSVTGNTAVTNGGGIYLSSVNLTMTGGSVTGNAAVNGGGIWNEMSSNRYTNNDMRKHDRIAGGEIAGNRATGNGGGIYNTNFCDDLKITGGSVRDNQADGYGGGVYLGERAAELTLKDDGKIYDNQAGLGQDVYANYNSTYRDSGLHLLKASDMFAEGEERTGIDWLDENRDVAITEAIDYDPVVRVYPLTLRYSTERIVAVIGEEQFSTVQKAVDAVKNDADGALYGKTPVIVMVNDSTENVTVPGGVDAVLNLNGHTLKGNTTAITCYGDLVIRDDPQSDGTAGSGTGTVTGNAPTAGGGVRVCSGGYVKLESGQISGSHAAGISSGGGMNTGGAGVCADYGTFELAGGSINHCQSAYGAAVLVKSGSSTFRMTGGVIEENTALNSGVVLVNGGTARITGGEIRKNTVNYAGTIHVQSGTLYVNGTEEEPVTLTDNTAKNRGGGLYMNSGTAYLYHMQISGNQAAAARTTDVLTGAGGGIYMNNGTLTLGTGVSLTGNEARRGGAIAQVSGTIRMNGGSVMKNNADMGGGLFQHPKQNGVFIMTGGALCSNRSLLTSAGNDIYSSYEGTDEYPGNTTTLPRATLLAAASMETTGYNVWKDDGYVGDSREGEAYGDGQYITGAINQCYGLQLTADKYGDTVQEDITTTRQVDTLLILKSGNTGEKEDGMITGNGSFDTASRTEEITAGELLNSGEAEESEETYTYNGEEQKYILYDNGEGQKKYEQDQAVTWSPGNDSSGANTIIRTYDTVSYQLDYTLSGGEEEELETRKLWVRAMLPCGPDQAAFDVDNSMLGYSIEEMVNDAGEPIQILEGCWEIAQNVADGEVNLAINVLAMKNGDTFRPEFKAWIGGNSENEADPASCQSKTLTVSASAGYNVTLMKNSALGYTGYFDLETGEEVSEKDAKNNENVIYGTMLGYGITLELYNESSSKGIKGLELPEGDIRFDLYLKGSLYLDGEPITDENGEPLVEAPYIWAYKENTNSTYGTNIDNTSYSFNMDWNDEDDLVRSTCYAWDAAPFNSGGGNYSCYSGGVWYAEANQGEQETVVHFKVNGYTVNTDTNPTGTSSGTSHQAFNSNRVKPFSAGYIQLIFPIDKENTDERNGYLQVNMQGALAGLEARSASGREPEGTSAGIEAMEEFFGENYEAYAKGEMTYVDNCLNTTTGLYVYSGSGNADRMIKTNYFNKSDNSVLSGDGGNGSTPLDSQVYIEGKMNYGSQTIDRSIEGSEHYIRPEDFDAQTDNWIEYNYMTAVNLLQKFDAEAYTPIGADSVIDVRYDLNAQTNNIGDGAFRITTTETATSWSSTRPYKTQSYDLTILYAAKPDGKNWKKNPTQYDTDGGTAEMSQYQEEDLIYFETLQDLRDYFGGDGVCVGILYQFRDCCIRSGYDLRAAFKAQVTDEFACTGKTYCTTNDVRCWSTFRPDYKEAYSDRKLTGTDGILYQYDWHDAQYGEENGVTAYGSGDGELPEGYGQYADGTEAKIAAAAYTTSYQKTEYVNGSPAAGTHTGNRSGNTLLLYTLNSSINITNTDLMPGSNNVKSSYDVGNGERTANFSITPSLGIASSVSNHPLVTNGSQATEVKIEVALPKHLNYKRGSVAFDYSPGSCKYEEGDLQWDVKYEENEDGTALLTLTTYVNDISKGLPNITYGCIIGSPGGSEDVPNGSSLTTKATIETTYEEISQIAAASHTATNSIRVVKTGEHSIFKDSEDGLTEVGEDLVYSLYYTNEVSNWATTALCDILPYKNDGRGTNFTGAYRLKQVEVVFTGNAVSGDLGQTESSVKLKWKNGLKTTDSRNGILEEANAGTNWTAMTLSEKKKGEDTTTFVFQPENVEQKASTPSGIGLYFDLMNVAPQGSVEIRLTLSPKDSDGNLLKDINAAVQTGGSVYWNDFFLKTSSDPVSSSKSFVRTVSRTMTGRVWLDMDLSSESLGKYVDKAGDSTSADRTLSGIDVYLYTAAEQGDTGDGIIELEGKKWKPAEDILGNPVEKAITASDGIYSFHDLKAGEYILVFRDDAGDYKVTDGTKELAFERLSAAQIPAGDPTGNKSAGYYKTADSAAAGAAPLTLAYTKNSVKLPEKESIQVGNYVCANQNCALYYTDQILRKEWVDLTGSVPEDTSVTLTVNGGIGSDLGSISYEAGAFNITKTSGGVSTSMSGPAVSALLTDKNAAETVTTDSGTGLRKAVWELHVPLQAKGSGGHISYTFSENALNSGKNPLTGFVMKGYETTEGDQHVYTAENAQILYEFEVTKVSASEDGSGGRLTIPKAEFTLYTDADCRVPLKSLTAPAAPLTLTTDNDGLLSFGNLPAGIYYLKETKAPSNYQLNPSVFELEIRYETSEAGTGADAEAAARITPVVTVTEIRKDGTRQPLTEIKPVATGESDPSVRYRVSLSVEDTCVYELPHTGGIGIWWNSLLGMALMLAAVWLVDRRRRAVR